MVEGRVCVLGCRTRSLAEISPALMIDANERVGHHHDDADDEHCAIFLERRFGAPSSPPIAAALAATQRGSKLGGKESTLARSGSSVCLGKRPTGAVRAAAFQTQTKSPTHTSNRRGER
jgi:hypothetical protein